MEEDLHLLSLGPIPIRLNRLEVGKFEGKALPPGKSERYGCLRLGLAPKDIAYK